MLRAKDHFRSPFLMLLVGLALIGSAAYLEAGPDFAEYAVKGSLQKLVIQIPAGIIALVVASKLIEVDFGPISIAALKIAAITVPFFSLVAELTVMLVGFFWLFELGKWETYLVLLLNLAAVFGVRYFVANYMDSSHAYWATGDRPRQARR